MKNFNYAIGVLNIAIGILSITSGDYVWAGVLFTAGVTNILVGRLV